MFESTHSSMVARTQEHREQIERNIHEQELRDAKNGTDSLSDAELNDPIRHLREQQEVQQRKEQEEQQQEQEDQQQSPTSSPSEGGPMPTFNSAPSVIQFSKMRVLSSTFRSITAANKPSRKWTWQKIKYVILAKNVSLWPRSDIPRRLLPVSHARHVLHLAFSDSDSRIGYVLSIIMATAIVLSICTFCVGTLPEYRIRRVKDLYGDAELAFDTVDTICVVIFTTEYILKFITATAVPSDEEAYMFRKHRRWRDIQKEARRSAVAEDATGIVEDTSPVYQTPAPPKLRAEMLEDNTGAAARSENTNAKKDTILRSNTTDLTREPVLPVTFTYDVDSVGWSTPALLQQVALRTVTRMVRFILHPLNIIDFIAIAPYFVSLTTDTNTDGGLPILRVLRLTRVLRLLKVSSRNAGFKMLLRTVSMSADALFMLCYLVALGVILFGTIMYFCESGDWDDVAQDWLRPDITGTSTEISPFRSIPVSFWWAIVTMSTVGYGDFYPTTGVGRALGSLVILSGLLVIALPITIIGSNFTEEYSRYKAEIQAGGDGFSLSLDDLMGHDKNENDKNGEAASPRAVGSTKADSKTSVTPKATLKSVTAATSSSASISNASNASSETLFPAAAAAATTTTTGGSLNVGNTSNRRPPPFVISDVKEPMVGNWDVTAAVGTTTSPSPATITISPGNNNVVSPPSNSVVSGTGLGHVTTSSSASSSSSADNNSHTTTVTTLPGTVPSPSRATHLGGSVSSSDLILNHHQQLVTHAAVEAAKVAISDVKSEVIRELAVIKQENAWLRSALETLLNAQIVKVEKAGPPSDLQSES